MNRSASAVLGLLAAALLTPGAAMAQDTAPGSELEALNKRLDDLAKELDALKAERDETPNGAEAADAGEETPSWTDEIKLGLFYVESVNKSFKLAIKGRLMVDSRHVIDRSDFDDHFQLRRARVEFVGHLFERVEYSLGLEFGRTSDADLRNAFIDIAFHDMVSLRAGQMLLPYSDLRLRSSKYLNHPERTMLIANMVGNRDIGAALHGSIANVVDYEVGVFGGVGQNKKLDNDDDVDFAGRVVIRPWSDHDLAFSLNGIFTPERTGASGPSDLKTVGNQFTTILDYDSDNDANGDRYRAGGGLRFSWGPVEFTAEANMDYHLEVRSPTNAEDDLLSWSWHADLLWVITGETLEQKVDGPKVKPDAPLYDPDTEQEGLGAFALAFRFEDFYADDNVLRRGFATGTDKARAGSATAHWYMWESVRFSLSYTYTDFDDSIFDSQGHRHHGEHSVLGRLAFYF